MQRSTQLLVAVIMAASYMKVTQSATCSTTLVPINVTVTGEYLSGTTTEVTCWGYFKICRGGCQSSFKFDVHEKTTDYNATAKCSHSPAKCCKSAGNHETVTVSLFDCTDEDNTREIPAEAPDGCSCANCIADQETVLSEGRCQKFYNTA